ncbi:MAG: radical SAM protein [Actinomycetota bacterium]|nr:radical SAM protein [Actinomycetota bacterium]
MTVLLQIGRRPPDPPPPADDPDLRVFHSSVGAHVFVVDGSRIYDLPQGLAPSAVVEALRSDPGPRRIDGRPLPPPPLYALSLNVLQACNMSCGYCYADEGRFGGPARAMTADTARAAVDRLIAESAPGSDVVVGFMGGEPLLARELVHEVTGYASAAAAVAGRRARFAITTNLTTVSPADARLFAEHGFAVSVSVDGPPDRHDAVRRMRGDASAYALMAAGLDVLRRHGRPRHLGARVTVTPRTGRLLPVLDHVIGLGFDEVGFAAVLASPDRSLAIPDGEFAGLLDDVVECGERALAELSAGRRYPFGNFETAMHQLHRGSHRPYPCGGGAAYLSAGAEGDLFTCHRFVDDPAHAMGTVQDGVDDAARARHLERGHVDRMSPCRSCWARYLCGGGCYHEVSRRGRPGCDYIRGWLDFCLRAYAELSTANPGYFASSPTPAGVPGSDPTTVAR